MPARQGPKWSRAPTVTRPLTMRVYAAKYSTSAVFELGCRACICCSFLANPWPGVQCWSCIVARSMGPTEALPDLDDVLHPSSTCPAGCKPKAPPSPAKPSWRRRQGCVGLLNDEDQCQALIRQKFCQLSSDWLPSDRYWSGPHARSLFGMAPQRRVSHVQITPSCCPSLCESFPGASDTPQPVVGPAGRRKCTKFPACLCNQHTAISAIVRSAFPSQKPAIAIHVSFA